MTTQHLRTERTYIAGVDVGQVNDWTAIAIIEKVETLPWFPKSAQNVAAAAAVPTLLDVRHLERIPLGTMYPEQRAIVQALLRRPQLPDVQTFLDMTGCGRPVFDMFKQAGLPRLQGVMITGAQGEATKQPYGWNVGKAELISRVQVEMQTGRLRFGRNVPNMPLLVRELKEFHARINTAGNTTFNAREGQHDDLVLALALAVFGAVRPRPAHSIDMRFAS